MLKFGIKQQRHHRQFGGGVGMRQAAADGPAVADGEMCHVRHGGGENRQMPGDHRRGFELMMPRERADTNVFSSPPR